MVNAVVPAAVELTAVEVLLNDFDLENGTQMPLSASLAVAAGGTPLDSSPVGSAPRGGTHQMGPEGRWTP